MIRRVGPGGIPRFMTAAARAARADHRYGTFLSLVRFACALAAAWSAAVAAASLGLIDEKTFYGILLAVSSSWPFFVLVPRAPGAARAAVRSIDDHALVETAVFGGVGPAKALVERAADALVAARPPERRTMRACLRERGIPRGTKAFLFAALAAIALAQTVSFLSLQKLSFGFASPDIEEGLRGANRSDSRFGSVRRAETDTLAPEDDGTAPEGSGPGRGGRADKRFPEDESVEGAQGATGVPRSDPSSGRDNGDDAAISDGDAQRASGESSSGGDGLAGEDRVGRKGSGEGAESKKAGWEGSGQSLLSDPMMDYRSYLDRIAVERGVSRQAAGEGTASKELEGFVERLFSSYRIEVAVDPIDDPTLEALRSAWRRAKDGFR
ncbi:MAG: hypothetical protein NT080_04975 [Spirochaetes bacterium]|nr:hypothetical protein [Spirochaetota bacterium]